MKRKLYAIFLGICLVFTQIPLVSFADAAPARTEEPVSYGVNKLYVGGVNALQTPQGEGWSFNAETSTLTLNNCKITSGSYREPENTEEGLPATDSLIYAEGQLILELVGDNYVEREITTVASEDTSFRAITVYGDNPILYDAPKENQWAMYVKGKGSLTTGVAFDHAVIENSYWIPTSYGIVVDMTNGLDLRGLKDGGTITIYGGDKEVPRTYNIKAMNNGPVWNEKHTVLAYQDLQGTMENDNGYNWNNNDAWNFRLISGPTYVSPQGILKILNDDPDKGEGWTWENEVLTLDGGSGTLQMEGIEFGPHIDYAKIKLESDVLLDASKLADTIPLITECVGGKLEIDAGNNTLTCKSSHQTYDSWANTYYESSGTAIQTSGDLFITGGKVEAIGAVDEYGGYDIYMSGDLMVQNGALICPSGEIHVYDEYNEENELYGGNVIVENGVIDAQTDYEWGMALYAEGKIQITNSDVTAESAYIGMRAVDEIEITEGSKVEAIGISDKGISSDSELHVTASDVHVQGETMAVEIGDFYNELPDTSIFTLTDAEMKSPENGEIKAFEYRYYPTDTRYYGRVAVFDGETQATDVQIKSTLATCTHETTTVINVLTQTCIEEGYSGDLICQACDEVLEYGVVIPADGIHDYDDGTITIEATCSTPGSKTYTCIGAGGKCGHTKTESYTDSSAHDWSTTYTVDKAATCTEAGSKSIHCKRCEATKNVTAIPVNATAHDGPTKVINVLTQTCFEEGYSGDLICQACEAILQYGEVIPPDEEHNYSDTYTVDKKATASAAGSQSKHCQTNGCEAKTSVTSIPKIASQKLSYTITTYSGSAKKPSVTIKDSAGNTLVNGTDYSVCYASGRTEVGRFKVTISYKGKYEGSKTLYFTIVPKAPASASATLSSASQTSGYDDIKFTWKASTGAKGYLVYYKKASASKWSGPVATTKTSYTKKNLTDGVKYTFKVVPYYKTSSGTTKYYSTSQYKTASVTTLTKVTGVKVAKSGTKVKVSWTNINGETGYQISKSTQKTGTNIVSTYKTTSGKSKTITATKGKTYYYKVRAYRIVDGKKIFGPWSQAKSYKRK